MATKRSKISPKELIAELERHGVYVITEIVTLLNDPDLSIELRVKIVLELIQYGFSKMKAVEITDNRDGKDSIEMLEQLKAINDKLAKQDVKNG